MAEESALLRACREKDISIIRTLLQNEVTDFSLQMNQLSFSGRLVELFMEYGHPIPYECCVSRYKDLQSYFDHDLTLFRAPKDANELKILLTSFEFNGKLKVYILVHHLLRQQGEFHSKIRKSMISWLVGSSDISQSGSSIVHELRVAVFFAIEEDAKRSAMIVARSLRKDWFLSYLNLLNLNVNELTYNTTDFFHSAAENDDEATDEGFSVAEFEIPIIHHSAVHEHRSKLLRFLVRKCSADVNILDSRNHTALMITCLHRRYPLKYVQRLIDVGADVNIIAADGLTALDYVTLWVINSASHWDKVLMLLQAGAVFGPKSNYSFAYLYHLAHKDKAEDVLAILEPKLPAATRRTKKPRYL